MNRRTFLTAASAIATVPWLGRTARDPKTLIAYPDGARGVYVGEIRYYPRRLSDRELAIATRTNGTLTVQLVNGRFDFTDPEWQRAAFS